MTKELSKTSAILNLEGLMNFFLRVLAIVFICFSVLYWIRLVGIADPEVRFDTMPIHWKLTSTILSVFFPIAALGLWGLFRWGIVIWFLVASLELFMHLGYPQLFGNANSLVIFHISSMSAWLLYMLINFLFEKRALIKER